MEREVGGGIGMGNTCKPIAVSFQCMTKSTTNKKRRKKKKESASNAGDPGSISGLGRFAGEGIGYPLQYSWASLVAQLVKNPPATRETRVQPLGWEDPLEKGKATCSSILAWRIPRTVLPWGHKAMTRVNGDDGTCSTSQGSHEV